MNDLIKISHKDQRVLTTQQLAESFGAEPKALTNNFSRNIERFTLGVHYFELEGADLQEFKGRHQIDDNLKFAPHIYLWTKRGAARHAKMLNTDEAWAIYEELEESYFNQKQPFQIPQSYSEALRLAADLSDTNQKLITQHEQDKPKVIFADAVGESKGTILVADLAKLLNQNGVEIGQNRLFKWLRDNGYLGKVHSYYNKPTQKAVDAELFTVIERPVFHNSGDITTSITPKVTGKGQRYFVDKFVELFGVKTC